jgi:hypothetical protein
VKEVASENSVSWLRRNSVQVGPERRREGSIPARLRIAQTVEAPTRQPMPASSPAMRRYPQSGFSPARRRITLRSDGDVGGRPDRWRLPVHRRLTKSACQRRSVPGVTNTIWRRAWGSSRANALRKARSAQDGRGRQTCRRKTFTWWRSTRISAVLEASDRARSDIQALS